MAQSHSDEDGLAYLMLCIVAIVVAGDYIAETCPTLVGCLPF